MQLLSLNSSCRGCVLHHAWGIAAQTKCPAVPCPYAISGALPTPAGPPAPSATFNILAALEGLVQLLPAPLSMLHIVTPAQHAPAGGGAAQDGGMAPSPLIAALLRPERQKLWGGHPGTGHAALMRIAGLITKVRDGLGWRPSRGCHCHTHTGGKGERCQDYKKSNWGPKQ